MAIGAAPAHPGEPMKLLLVSSLLVPAALLAQTGEGISGKWDVHTVIAGNESRSACTFTQSGDELSGSCETTRGKVEIKGKVEGKTVSWAYKSEYDGTPLTVAYKGTLESAAKITGGVTVDEFSVDGEFTATQSS
jgi:hypothetical protein